MRSALDETRQFLLRRSKQVAIVTASLIVVTGLGIGLLYTGLFAIDRIEVVGNQRVDRQTILTTSGLRLGEPIVSVDEAAVARSLENEPRVGSASVETSWSGAVRISVTEREPLLLVRTGDDRWSEVGDDGINLSVADQPAPGLPAVIGATIDPVVGSRLDDDVLPLVDVARALPESLRPSVSQMQIDDGNIRLGLVSGVIVIVGNSDRLGEKLTSAAAVLRSQDEALRKLSATLDVSSPTMPVSTPRTTTPSPAQTDQQTTTTTNPRSRPSSEG